MTKLLKSTGLLLLLLTPHLHAEVKPNSLFSDGVVLQRVMEMPVWGTADKGEPVTVEFAGQKVSAVAVDGRWMVKLHPLQASTVPAEMTISGSQTKVIVHNVLVGEVWICSGQSNMEFRLGGNYGVQVDNVQQEIAAANYPSIRAFDFHHTAQGSPIGDVNGQWMVCSPKTAPRFSAVAYFFGRDLQKAANVPVGLILSSWGGTPAEAWVSRETLQASVELAPLFAPKQSDPSSGTVLYNGMIAPLQPFAIRGVIWYQGESNSGRGRQYRTLFPALIGDWRAAWGEGDFPFLYVQIAPFDNSEQNDPAVREAQLMTLSKTPKTAMVVTTDIGEAKNIHPPHKQQVGARLALAARAVAYGEKVECSGPIFQRMDVKGSQAVLSFSHAAGLATKGGALRGFVIAGPDHQFHPAEASIFAGTVVVSSPDVAQPVAVRYGWARAPDVNLFNGAGLPASPFRTDTDGPDDIMPATSQVQAGMHVWPSRIPAGCPVEQSSDFVALGFTGHCASYGGADTWYPSWGADNRLYSPFADGTVTVAEAGKPKTVKSSCGGGGAAVGHAIITGDDPLKLEITEAGVIGGTPAPYGGRYPCASLYKDGVWYLGTYALNNASYGLNWPICGPFAGFHISKDGGKTWTPSPHTCAPGKALFPEPAQMNGPVKFGVPHVVDFGRNMENSPDGLMYMVAHGSLQKDMEDRPANLSWITGDQLYLCRVKPSPETVNDAKAYEYFCGRDAAGKDCWTKDLALAKPILDWNNYCGGVTITYDKPLGKYLMCVTNGGNTESPYDSYVMESARITGPWKIITYMKNFGVQAYFLNIPSKFIGKDGRSFWLCYSANWGNLCGKHYPSIPPGGTYSMTLQEVRLLNASEAGNLPEISTDPSH